jgi:putative membrane protein
MRNRSANGRFLTCQVPFADWPIAADATSLGMTPPTSPNKKQAPDSDRMSKLSGAQFDRRSSPTWLRITKEYEKAAKKRDAAGSYAAETLQIA